MFDPVTWNVGTGVAAFLGNMLYDAAKEAAGSHVVKKIVEHAKGETFAHLAGAYGLATNHDAEKAIRRAQMAALRYLVTQYGVNAPKSDESGNQFLLVFTDAAFAFADECTRRCDHETLELKGEVIATIEKSLNARLGAVRVAKLEARAAALRRAAAEAAFVELQAAMAARKDSKTNAPIVVPDGFRAMFFDGAKSYEGEDIECWYDAFFLQAADALKGQNPDFEKIFTATRLGAIAELSLDTNEVVQSLKMVIAKSALLAADNTHRLARMASAIEQMRGELAVWRREDMAAHDKTQQIAREAAEEARKAKEEARRTNDLLRELLLRKARENDLDPRVLVPIFERLGMRGLSGDEMRDQAEAAVAAFLAYVDGKLEKSNLGEDIDQAIEEARALARTLGRDAAGGRLDQGIEKEDRAIAEAREALRDHVQRKVALMAEKARLHRAFLDYGAARRALADIIRFDPESAWAFVERGEIERIIGTLDSALGDFRAALAIDRRSGDELRIGVDLDRIGDVLVSRNDLDGALKHYAEGLEISRRLAAADPSHAERARDVSVSLDRIGDGLVSRNDLDGALKHYAEGLEIRRRLAAADPSHAERARDVSVSVNKIGDVLVSRNDLDGALKHYAEGLEIRRRLAAADPSHAERARDVSVSVNKIGDVLRSRNDLDGALTHYAEGLEIRRRLAAADPSHAERARDVSVSLDRIGDGLRSRNDLDGALTHYAEGLEIRRRLAAADPSHAERARDVSVSLMRIGDVLRSRNDLDGALTHYAEGLEIRRRLAAADPSHAERARDVSVSVNKIGDVLVSRNDLDGALTHYAEGLEISRRLAAADPSHAERARDVSVSVNKIGDVLVSRNDLDGALTHYAEGLEIRRRLAAADPSHAERARDVSVSLDRIGDVLVSRNDLDGALTHYAEGLEISRRLAAADPSHAERARDVSVSLMRIGDVLVSRNDLDGALTHYAEGLEISRRLAAADPSHAERARDVSVSLMRLGRVHQRKGDKAAACRKFTEARAITASLARRAPDVHVLKGDAQWLDARIAETCGSGGGGERTANRK